MCDILFYARNPDQNDTCSNIQDLSSANIRTSVQIWKDIETYLFYHQEKTLLHRQNIIYKHTLKLISSLLYIFKYKVKYKVNI